MKLGLRAELTSYHTTSRLCFPTFDRAVHHWRVRGQSQNYLTSTRIKKNYLIINIFIDFEREKPSKLNKIDI